MDGGRLLPLQKGSHHPNSKKLGPARAAWEHLPGDTGRRLATPTRQPLAPPPSVPAAAGNLNQSGSPVLGLGWTDEGVSARPWLGQRGQGGRTGSCPPGVSETPWISPAHWVLSGSDEALERRLKGPPSWGRGTPGTPLLLLVGDHALVAEVEGLPALHHLAELLPQFP